MPESHHPARHGPAINPRLAPFTTRAWPLARRPAMLRACSTLTGDDPMFTRVHARAGAIALLVLVLAPVGGVAQAPASTDSARDRGKPDLGPMRTIEFDIEEGTWTSLDVSPDGRTIVFDLLGDLYTLPIDGGEAKLLLGGRDWDHMPRFSPDGSRIAFVSDRDGNMNVWLIDADGSDPKVLTKERVNKMKSPAWTPDGRFVIAHKSAPTGAGLYMYHVDGGSGFRVDSANGSGPAFSPDGRFLFFSSGGIQRLDRRTGQSVRLTHGSGGGVRPVVSPDGRHVAYARMHDHENALHLRDLQTGADRMLVRPITPRSNGNQDELPGYAFTPDGRAIVLTIAGRIHRVDVASAAVTPIPFLARVSQQVADVLHIDRRVEDGPLDARVTRWPSLSPDRRSLVFSVLGKLYVADVPAAAAAAATEASAPGSSRGDIPPAESGPRESEPRPPVADARRLTNSNEREYTPVWSPDGQWIAYTTWSDAGLGHLRLLSRDGRRSRTLSSIPGRYTNPVWSADGSKIAFVRGSGVEMRGGLSDDDPYVEIVWLPVAEGGEPRFVTASPYNAGFALRYYPVLSFSPDGERIFFTERSSGGAPGSGQRTTFSSIRLDGTDKRGLLRFVPVDEVIPSPDGRNVAFARRENVVVAEIPDYTTGPIDLSFDGGALPVKTLTREGGVFLQWLDANTLGWSFTNTYYSQRLDADSAKPLIEVAITRPRAKPEGSIAFTNARIVTMKGDEVIERGTIVVAGNRISAIGPGSSVQVPAGATVVDAAGRTIVPGLIDTHAHMHYASMEFHPQQKWEYIAQLAYGTTTTFDPSAHNLDVFAQYEMVETGDMIGPRIYSTGDVIYGTETVFPVVYEPISSIEDARHVVRRYKAYDPAMLKQYMQPRRDQRQWLRQAAAEEGVMITAEGGVDWVLDMTMVLDGYTAVEHNLPIELHDDVIQLYARSGTNYTPTLVVAYGGPSVELYFHNKGDYHDNPKLRRFVPESELDAWRRHQRIPEEEWHFKTVARNAAEILKAGGDITVGAHGQLQGLGTLWELWGMAMGGLTPLEAIRIGTFVGAQKLGFARDLGSLEPGKLADFLVLDANPLDDIMNLEQQRFIVKNGFVYDAETLTEVWPAYRPLEPFFWMPEEDRVRFRAPPAARIGAR
jgi:Tol biopolymer transport system component/imidazolonepropionase-like amidohydrolase